MLKRFLVIFPGALGDFICFLPALERLSGEGEVNLLARSDYSDLVPPGVTVGSLECREISRLFVAESGREDGLARLFDSYAAVYSWLGSGEANFVRNLQALTDGNRRVFPFRPAQAAMHMVDYYLSCLDVKDRDKGFPSVNLQSEAVSWADRFWRQSGLEGRKILALSPGSGARAKNWPVQSFQAVARWWEKERKGKVIVLFGPVEEERDEAHDFSGDWVTIRNLELGKVAALLDRCALYLGNDSGVSHLAAALGVETFVLFGPTDPAQWAPRGKKVTVVRNAVECSPCTHSIMKACPHRKCLTALPPNQVTGLLGSLPSFLSYSD